MGKRINLMQIVFSLEIGGLEILVLNLLSKLDRIKYDLSVCSLSSDGVLIKSLEELRIPVFSFKKRDGIDLLLIFRLAKLLKKRRVDLIHTHNPPPWFYGVLAAKIAGVKAIIHTEHSCLLPHEKKLMVAEKYLSNLTDVIIADSEEVTQNLTDKLGVSSKKVRTVLNGIDFDKFGNVIDIQRKKKDLGIPVDSLVLGNIARLEPVKDHLTLLEAFHSISESVPQAVLVIVGDGSQRENLQNKTRELKIENRVFFLGARDDIPEIIKTFDIFTLTSTSEGLSLALVEAMAASKPIIATDVGGNYEVVINGKTGFLVPPQNKQELAQKLRELLENSNMAKLMGDNGYRRAKKLFDVNVMKDRYEEIYDNLNNTKINC